MIGVVREGNAATSLRALMAKLEDTSALMPKLGEHAMDSQKLNIEESRSPNGAPFKPLKNSRRPGHPYGNKPLIDTSRMYQSIHYRVRSRSEVFSGPDLNAAPYFPRQNQGTGRIPARTFIGLRPEDANELRDLAAEWLAGVLY